MPDAPEPKGSSERHEHPTRIALMRAALDRLEGDGVLSGLKMREVAEVVGVTPANIYHHFDTKQGLLRAALHHEVEARTAEIDAAVHSAFVDWRTEIFDMVTTATSLRMTALLALDGDPAYEPLELWPLAQEHYGRLVEEGELPEDLDVVATHVLTLSVAMGVAIYGAAVAQQVGVTEDELRQRVRALFTRLLESMVTD